MAFKEAVLLTTNFQAYKLLENKCASSLMFLNIILLERQTFFCVS